jgi:hypothetical protein
VIALLNSVQFAPPSVVSCRLPSSVPTQRIFGSSGDSAKFEISLMRRRRCATADVAVDDAHHLERVAIDRARQVLLRVQVDRSPSSEQPVAAEIHRAGVWRDAITGASQSKR